MFTSAASLRSGADEPCAGIGRVPSKRLLAAANNDDGGTRPTRSAEPRGETMIRCQQCGLHVPEREAFRHRGLGFCSQEHQRQYLEHHEP